MHHPVVGAARRRGNPAVGVLEGCTAVVGPGATSLGVPGPRRTGNGGRPRPSVRATAVAAFAGRWLALVAALSIVGEAIGQSFTALVATLLFFDLRARRGEAPEATVASRSFDPPHPFGGPEPA